MTIEIGPPADYPAAAFERVPPQDEGAELYVLAACMQGKQAVKTALEILTPAAFYRPVNATVFQGISEMQSANRAIDPITLNKHLADAGKLSAIGGPGYLHWILQQCPYATNPGDYAEIVHDRAVRRELIKHGTTLAERGFNTETATSDLVEHAVKEARDLRDQGMAAEDLPTEDILDFVEHEDTFNWIVPGLLERMDRLILTASEGGGKSTLLRQMSVTLAAGIHPFRTFEMIDPVKVLTLDCENSAPASRRKYRPLLAAADHIEQPVRRGMFHIECRPEGLDLTQPRDRAWMMRRVEKIKPDVLIIGPVYRLHAGDPNSEELARKVSVVIDEARSTAGCAVLLEAHAPHHNGMGQHRNLRPLGSSLWMRWPEFGFGLRPVEDEKSAANTEGCRGRRVVPWRGMRDERDWPAFIKQGEKWPWETYRPMDADQFTGYSPTGAIW
ncbi:AAA family ATPase [Streptomyces sp. NPDC051582]|uniref:AAA family ATPase n=1 Tax=Streptomyces sp. NPDC051582 TaxID=3155167 RepID=UPI0034274071